MAVLTITKLTKTYGLQTVLNAVSLTVNVGERLGLVGANGVGKSTLLKIITGQIAADDGAVSAGQGVSLGYLPQVFTGFDDQPLAQMIEASLAEVRALETQMRDLEAAMAERSGAELDAVVAAYGEISEQFERRGGYDLDYRVQAVLSGLGVDHLPREQRFGTLSGGERARVGLALLLLRAPDVLLLDEPTNHLDFTALDWLERYLSAYGGAILVVSHDREFLNRTVTAIVEIDEQTRQIKRYSGDYDTYHRAKVQERHKWETDYARQQEEIATLQLEARETARGNNNYRTHTDADKYIRNFKIAQHDTTVSKRVRLAEEKLRRILENPIPPPPVPLRFDPRLNPEALQARLPLVASNLTRSFDGRRVLDGVSFTVGLNSRILLAGPNGTGKSTLLKVLLGLDRPDAGEVIRNPAARIGYLDQQTGDFGSAQTLYEAFAQGLEGSAQHFITMLIRSGLFRYEDMQKPVSGLSSGQRRKLQIARLIFGRANLLILDEPTNDVSFDVLEGLEAALRDFPGPVIAASHDRRFMQHFGGEIWTLIDGRLVKFLDGYAAYSAAQAALAVG
jgi:macrolide transport system ATP-binding/permease protein